MPVVDKDAGPTAVVVVIELHPPSQPVPDLPQTSPESDVIEVIVAAIKIESRCVIAEVCLHDALFAGVRVIIGGEAHAGLFRAILVVGHASVCCQVTER